MILKTKINLSTDVFQPGPCMLLEYLLSQLGAVLCLNSSAPPETKDLGNAEFRVINPIIPSDLKPFLPLTFYLGKTEENNSNI